MLYSEYLYEKNLIEAAQSYAKECKGEFNPDIRDAFIHGAEWQLKLLKIEKYDL